MNQLISREDLKTLIASDKKHTIVEALPKKYYEAEHLPGAINLPHDEVQAAASRLIPDKNETVIVYCASAECKNSHVAAEALRGLGYSRVYEYTEGKKGWKEAGLQLENGGGAK
jgi:rhodanese-related sulfurtransferase